MRKETSVASMIGIVGTDNGVDAVLIWSRLKRILLEIGSPSAMMAVNVLPGLSIDKGQLVRSDTDNGAVALMELLDAGSQVAFPINPDPEDA